MRAMRTWLKRIYWTDEREDAAFWQRWVSVVAPGF
jgi:hypothetical protein